MISINRKAMSYYPQMTGSLNLNILEEKYRHVLEQKILNMVSNDCLNLFDHFCSISFRKYCMVMSGEPPGL